MRLQVLGPIALTRGDASSTAPLLTQPRRLAVLVYLVLARPRGLHSRDTVMSMLWPESDQAGGRHALRNVLHSIRQALGNDIITSAGDGMVGVNFERISCDALELENAIASANGARVIDENHGELLQGFHVSDAPEFERWVDEERRRLGEMVLAAGWAQADAQWKAGDVDGAIQTARRVAALAPDDEIMLRKFLKFLDSAGDRFGALRAYEEFAERLKSECDAEPSSETQALVRALRETPRRAEKSHPPAPRMPVTTAEASARTVLVGTPEMDAAASNARDSSAPPPSPQEIPTARRPDRSRKARFLWAAAVLAVIAAAGIAMTSRSRIAPRAETPSKLLVLPMDNETGDTALAYVGTGLTEGIAKRLEGIGGITVRSGARSEWPPAVRHDFREIGKRFGSVILLKTKLRRLGDSLEVRASVLDLASSRERQITVGRFTTSGLRDMESELAASVAGAVFRVPLPSLSRDAERRVNAESYRLMLQGFQQQIGVQNLATSKDLFLAAIRADPLNARAWAGLSSAWVGGSGGGNIVGENLDEVEAAAARALTLDSLQGMALANIGLARAFRYRNLADGLEWLKKATRAEPSNPHIFLGLGVLYRHAWMWDEAIDAFRIAERLDPLSPLYLNREAAAELCAQRPSRALPLFEREHAMSSTDTVALTGIARSYAALGRYADAIKALQTRAAVAGDTALAEFLRSAKDRSGYFDAIHVEGRRRVAELERHGGKTLRMMQAHFAAGDADRGFAELEQIIRDGDIAAYRLPCMPDLDEVRGSPRYEAALKRIGPLPQR